MTEALEKGLLLRDPLSIKTNMYTAQFCQKNIGKKTAELEQIHEELKVLIAKKPRTKE